MVGKRRGSEDGDAGNVIASGRRLWANKECSVPPHNVLLRMRRPYYYSTWPMTYSRFYNILLVVNAVMDLWLS